MQQAAEEARALGVRAIIAIADIADAACANASEILHDGDDIHLTMVRLPAINAPQFGWALKRTGKQVAARAIVFAALHRRREVWVGLPTVIAILANRLLPSVADRYLARAGYHGQLGQKATHPDAAHNLYEPVAGAHAAERRFGDRSRRASGALFNERHKNGALVLAAAGLTAGLIAAAKTMRPKPRTI